MEQDGRVTWEINEDSIVEQQIKLKEWPLSFVRISNGGSLSD